jgi:hypothetical protein
LLRCCSPNFIFIHIPIHTYAYVYLYSCFGSTGRLNARVDPKIYDDAVGDWEMQFPQFAKYGWGPSVQAEKWNGRHAMFGWFFICTTAYCKGHGLLPAADVLLDMKQWGTLASISGMTAISAERAYVLMVNVHAFAISLMAAFLPPVWGDQLFTEPGPQKAGYGYLPELKLGMTEEAEILNGRLAMLGLFALAMATVVEQKPMLDIVNEWVGGAYY